MKTAYILAAYRTPGCRANKGGFKDMRPDDLAAVAIKGLIERTGIDPMRIDDVLIGCAFPEGEQGTNFARIAALKAGLPYQVPAQTINRFCSSGLQTIASAAERIIAGFADCIVAGGAESMTMIPMGGNKYSANPGLVSSWPESYAAMGITAELVADKYAINREQQDAFAVGSHQKAAAAIAADRFSDELIPVEVEETFVINNKLQKNKKLISIDDGVRADTSLAGLAKLSPAFKLYGTVTAGTSSQMTDGAAAVLVVSEEYLKSIDARRVLSVSRSKGSSGDHGTIWRGDPGSTKDGRAETKRHRSDRAQRSLCGTVSGRHSGARTEYGTDQRPRRRSPWDTPLGCTGHPN